MEEDPKTKNQIQSLMRALQKNDSQRLKSLLSANANEVNPNSSVDSALNSVLHRAARYGYIECVEALISLGGDPRTRNKFGMTPLHHGAVAGSAEVLSLLLKAGGKAADADEAGRLPIHWTCGNGFVEATRVLLEEGRSKAEVRCKDGWTPLHRCCQEKPPEMVSKKKLEEMEEKQKESGEEPPDQAEILRKEDEKRAAIVELLLKSGANAMTRELKGNHTCLHLAAMNGYAKTSRVLLEVGKADINAVNKIEQRPLMYACAERHPEAVKTLLEFGPDLAAANKLHWGWTALHWAALQDDTEIVRILLEAGAHKELKDDTGRSAVTLAEEHDKFKVLDVFKEY